MVGRGTLIVIVGFTIIFGIAGTYWNRMSTGSVDNFLEYYNQSTAHSIAEAAANLGGNQIFVNQPSNSSFHLSGSFSAGQYYVEVDSTGQYQMQLTATGTYPPSGVRGSVTETIQVMFGANNFSTFGIYTASMSGVYLTTGDTVWGTFHSEGSLNVTGTPVFYGRVTSLNGISGGGHPIFYGSYQSGVSIPWSSTSVAYVLSAATSGGQIINNPSSPSPFDVYMTLNSNATVTYHTSLHMTDTTATLSSFAPNGVIFVNNGNLHLKGTVNGQYTIAAGGSSSQGLGSVYIDGNVKCNSDPMTNSSSTDMVGIVAQNNVWVESDNAYNGIIPTNPPFNPLIEAAILAQNGAFQCYYQSNYHYANLGLVNVYGSISNYQLGVTSDASGTYGYNENYKFDTRFSNSKPPSFPLTKTYRILSWYE